MSEQAAATNVIYRKRGASGLDKALLSLAFLLGAAGIVGLKSYGFEQLEVTAWPVMIMLIYQGTSSDLSGSTYAKTKPQITFITSAFSSRS